MYYYLTTSTKTEVHSRPFAHAEVVYTKDYLDFTPFHKQVRLNCSQALLIMCHDKEENFCGGLITQDKIWDNHYDPETKVQSKQWKHDKLTTTKEGPCPILSRQGDAQVK